MSIDSKYYIHPSDRAALKALKAIPGFHQLMKAFMGIWQEKLFNITNMSSNFRVSDKQLKKYYDMLPPICEKLGIEIPELYVELDVQPNAYTYGDTKPFICITTGLLERFPDELVKTVIAHECGHIACHHTLYRTMGQLILSGALGALPANALGLVVSEPVLIAFSYWMRCSEFSADRAAIICDGEAESLAQTCMRLAGYDPKFGAEADLNEFMKQAEDYREMMKSSKVNKLMEFYQYRYLDHPLIAVRASEASKWVESDDAKRILAYLDNSNSELLEHISIPVPDSSKKLVGQDYQTVKDAFIQAGFTRVNVFETESSGKFKKEGSVIEISIDEKTSFSEDEWFPSNALISIRYRK